MPSILVDCTSRGCEWVLKCLLFFPERSDSHQAPVTNTAIYLNIVIDCEDKKA